MGNGGDVLARGGHSAQFRASDGNITQDKWSEAVGEDVTEAFLERIRRKAISEGLSEEQFEANRAAAAAEVAKIEEETKQAQAAAEAKIQIRAVQDRIIVRRVEVVEQINGVTLADESKEKPYEGIVVAVGPGRYYGETFVKPTVEVGEMVVFGKFSGAEVKVGSRDLLVLREEDVFYVKTIVE
jgi:chaperonin GroES